MALHTGAFGIYSILIGHLLLHREESELWPFVMFAFAMALHFATNDLGLRQDHNDRYDRIGPSIIGVVILNAPKEKLPKERQDAVLPFALGGAADADPFVVTG